MNMAGGERFHELAHKKLARQAEPTELAELSALTTENPELKRTLAELEAEAEVARTLLPLLEDSRPLATDVPAPPLRRLREEIREVFEHRPQSQRETRELLARLERWFHMQADSDQGCKIRPAWFAFVSSLRQYLAAPGGQLVLRESSPFDESVLEFEESALPSAQTEFQARQGRLQDGDRRQFNLEARLRSLEARLRQAEATAQECRQEVRTLLTELAREQSDSAKSKPNGPN